MRILQIVHGFPPDAWAGTEVVTLHLAQGLQARGHAVTVLTRTEDHEAQEFAVREEQYDDVAVLRVVNNHTQTTTFRLFYDNPFYDALFLQLLERLRPDVVHFQHIAHFSIRLLALARTHGYPTILSLHDFFFPCHRIHLIDAEGRLCPGPDGGARCVPCLQEVAPPEDVRHRLATMEQVLQAAQLILTPSRFLAERIARYFPSVQEKLRIVPLGVKPLALSRRRARQPQERLRVLYSGLLFPPKGAHILIDAIQGLPIESIAVSLYGAILPYWHSYVDQLRAKAQGMAVQFCGKYAHNQWGEILSAHDVLVMPMICEETFSLVTREALQAGVPVIAARRGALPAVIEDGVNGLLFEPEDVADLRQCLLRLLNEPDLLERLRSAQSQFKTVNEYAEEMEEIYREVSSEKSETAKRAKSEKEEENTSTPFPSSLRPVGQDVHAISAVSVLIPTKNGAKYLAEVLDGVRKQQGDFRLQEIIAVDSGSRDETAQILKQYGVTVVQIPPQEFGHGKTRNLLASRAQGKYLVFLTQDATPANDRWLHNLLAPLQADSQIAGAYSRHLPRPTCHPMEWHRIVALDCPTDSSLRSAIDNPDFALHPERYRGFANTSSVLRRSAWEQFPFPEVDFAEDQAWAECVLRAGYKTAYVADSIIFHSHSYGPWTNFCRHFEHFVAMRQVFAQEPARKLKDCVPATLQGVRSNLAFWYQQSGQSKTHVALRWALPALSWYMAAEIGMWLGERYDRLPQWLVQRLSLQERVKRR